MLDRKWEIFGGAAGVLFAISLVGGILPGGVPPTFGSSAGVVVSYFTSHQGGLHGTFFVGNVLPTVLGALFSATLFYGLWRAEPFGRLGAVIGLVGAVTIGAFAAALSIVWTILVYDASQLGASSSVIAALYDGTVEAGAASIFIEGLVAFGFGASMTRLAGPWRQIGVGGVVVGLISFAVGIVMFAADFKTGALPLLGFAAFVFWTLVVGIVLAARGLPDTAQA